METGVFKSECEKFLNDASSTDGPVEDPKAGSGSGEFMLIEPDGNGSESS